MDYKNQEALHYDKKALKKALNKKVSVFDKTLFKANEKYFTIIQSLLSNNNNLVILDYGCGTGEKHLHLCSDNVKLIGIDISEKSIEFAKNLSSEKKYNAEFYVDDCEKTRFDNNTFDIILDFGTFSSLNLQSAVNEIVRILKPNGYLIAFETYGHNPLFNLKRKFNVLFGKRTSWAGSHIIKKKDYEFISSFFEKTEIYYFGLFTSLFVPLIILMPNKISNKFLTLLNKFDQILFRYNFFKKLSFKTIAVFNHLKK
jgi:SAM-dependent methyltransferase